MFDGPSGWIVGKLMASQNAAAEREAVTLLAPRPGQRVLVLGFGPGVGLQHLLKAGVAEVWGVDPSAAMLAQARKRNRAAILEGRLHLEQCRADQLCDAAGKFDGAIAVNTIQMCRPIAPTAQRLAEALAPEARLVTLTHAWAARKDFGSEDAFCEEITSGLIAADFSSASSQRGQSEKGTIIAIEALR